MTHPGFTGAKWILVIASNDFMSIAIVNLCQSFSSFLWFSKTDRASTLIRSSVVEESMSVWSNTKPPSFSTSRQYLCATTRLRKIIKNTISIIKTYFHKSRINETLCCSYSTNCVLIEIHTPFSCILPYAYRRTDTHQK